MMRSRLRHVLRGLVLLAWLPAAAIAATVLPASGTVEILFTPGDRIDRRLVAVIEAAREDVRVLAYTFTDRAIARALIAAHARGLRVEVIADATQAQEVPHSVLAELARGGVDVWLDAPAGSAHNKVLVIDESGANAVTVTGSFNLTRAAQFVNAENVVIFHDPEVARIYARYFESRRANARPWSAPPAARPRAAERGFARP